MNCQKKSEAKLLCCLSEWIIGFLDMRIGGVGGDSGYTEEFVYIFYVARVVMSA